ncbi:MAG: c-type cytochrome [Gammaproteobacteria bacterium]
MSISAEPPTVDSGKDNVLKYAQMYQKSCSACHGEKGNGRSRARYGMDPAPRNFSAEGALDELSRERMISSVTHGRPGTAMVGWGKRLSKVEIEGIVDYVRATFMKSVGTVTVSTGERIYKETCAVCHGDDGNSARWTKSGLNPAPRDFTTDQARKELSRERMINSVTHGRPGTAMMPFASRYNTDEISQVVNFIRSTFMKGDREDNLIKPVESGQADAADRDQNLEGHPHRGHSPDTENTLTPGVSDAGKSEINALIKVDMNLEFPHGLTGNAEGGRAFYMNNCYTCHGVNGDGNGPRSKFINPKPRNFTAELSKITLNRPALFKAVLKGKPGTVMPAWGKVLSEQEIADVAEFVLQAFILPERSTAEQRTSPDVAEDIVQKKKL